MFLGISPTISNWSPAADEFSLMLENNPLAEFVELPEEHSNLKFSNIIVGVLRGALEMVRFFLPDESPELLFISQKVLRAL